MLRKPATCVALGSESFGIGVERHRKEGPEPTQCMSLAALLGRGAHGIRPRRLPRCPLKHLMPSPSQHSGRTIRLPQNVTERSSSLPQTLLQRPEMAQLALGHVTSPSRVLTALSHPHGCLTPLVVGCRSVGSLVVPARPAPRIPDAPDAAVGCTESGANGAGTPAAGPPTRCPALAAARCPAPARSAANCSPPRSRSGRWRSTGAEQDRRVFMPRPGNQQRPHRRFHTDAVRTTYLIEAQPLLHFLKDQFSLPPGTIHLGTSAADQVAASSVVISSSPPATARVGTVMVRPAFCALRCVRQRARWVAWASSLAATSRTR